jgi:hypothetical protein
MHARNDRDDLSVAVTDAAARSAIELRADRPLSDAEWSAMRGRILKFADILRVWDRKTTASRRGKVEVLCQREL